MIRGSLWALQHPRLMTLIAALVAVPAVYFCTQLKLDNDPRQLAPPNPETAALTARHDADFSPDDTLFLLVLTGDDNASVIRATETAVEAAQGFEEVLRVSSPTTIRVPPTFSPAFGRKSKMKGSVDARIEALNLGSGGGRVISDDGRTVVIGVRLDDPFRDPMQALPIIDKIEASVGKAVGQNITVHGAGLLATRVASVRSIFADLFFLFPLAGLVVFLVGWSRFRSVRRTIAIMICLNWSILVTAGTAGALGIALNPLTQIFPILLMIIGIADGLHLIDRFTETKDEGVGDPKERWSLVLNETGRACLLTTVTTAIGFLALLTTQIPVLHDFAILVATGVCVSFLANLYLLPTLINWCPDPSFPARPTRGQWLGRVADASFRRAPMIMAGGVILLIGALVLDSRVNVDFFLSRVLDSANSTAIGNDKLKEQFGGSIPVEATYELDSGTFRDPENLRRLAQVTQLMREKTGGVISQSETLMTIKRTLSESDSFPKSRAEVSQLMLLLESARLPPLLSADEKRARLGAVMPDRGTSAFLELKSDLAEHDLRHPGGRTILVGSMMAAADGFGSVVRELISGLGVALVLIIIIIGIQLRSVRAAAASLLPNTIPIAVGLAFFALGDRYLDIFSAVFFTIALGIAVDDTIHLLVRYQDELKRHDTPEEAMSVAARRAGSAIADTSWILMSGFALLMFSEFPANRVSGLLAAGLIGGALIADLVWVPAAVSVFKVRGREA